MYAAAKADTFLTFAQRDDVNGTRYSLVKVYAPEGEFNTGADYRGYLRVTLVEMVAA